MSARSNALTAEFSPLYPVGYGDLGAGSSEPSVGTALRQPLAIVWRNPRPSESVPTGLEYLNLVRQHGSELSLLNAASDDSWGFSQFASGVPTMIYPSAGFREMGNSESTLSGLVFRTTGFWGASQSEGALQVMAAPMHGVWGNLRFENNLLGPAILTSAVPIQPSRVETPAVLTRGRSAEGRFRMAFQRAIGERFEDGMESHFSIELKSLLESFGADSIDILGRLLADGTGSPIVCAEALRWIGRAEEFLPQSDRMSLLERALSSDSAVVRDAASLGLATIDDPVAIPFLERAVASEALTELKADIQQVLEQLRGR